MPKLKEGDTTPDSQTGATVSSKAWRTSGKIGRLFATKFGFERIAPRVGKGRVGEWATGFSGSLLF